MPDVEPRHSMGAFTTFFDREVVLFSPESSSRKLFGVC